jgi:multiple sugar transport system substrate-binding protein
MRGRFAIGVSLAILACAVFLAACGGDDSGGGASSSGGGSTKGAKAVDPASMDSAKGNITYCSGKDTSGDIIEGIANFNKEFGPDLKVTLKEFPTSADEQRNQFIQRQRAKSGECDGFESDVLWTAEFASQKWILDVSKYMAPRKSEYIPSTLESVTFDGKVWGVPKVTDAGFLFYRTDAVKKPPATWQEAYKTAQAANPKGIVYQGQSYEGLTVDYLELAFAAGGKVLSDDGKKSEINSPENLKALEFMVNGVKDGAAPKSVTTYDEEGARLAFEAGKSAMMRNWPYAYALDLKAKPLKGKLKVIPLPAFEGGGKAGIIGGHNMVISAYSENPGATLKFIDYMTNEKSVKLNAVKYSKAPPLKSTYQDPAVKKAIPFSSQLQQAVEQAKSRPVSPVYTLISTAIYKNVNSALSGGTSPQDALKKADADINKALQTF